MSGRNLLARRSNIPKIVSCPVVFILTLVLLLCRLLHPTTVSITLLVSCFFLNLLTPLPFEYPPHPTYSLGCCCAATPQALCTNHLTLDAVPLPWLRRSSWCGLSAPCRLAGVQTSNTRIWRGPGDGFITVSHLLVCYHAAGRLTKVTLIGCGVRVFLF